jgi:hypothetical protein
MSTFNARLVTRFAALEEKLDSVLFRAPDDDEKDTKEDGSGVAGKIAKGAAAVGGGLYAGSVIARGMSPLVKDRLAGLRSTVPGFTQKSQIGQKIAAVGSVLKDKPLGSLKSVGATIAGDVGTLKRAITEGAVAKGYARTRAQGVGVLGAVRRGLGGGVAALTRGRVKFAATGVPGKVVELAAKL